MQWMAGSKLAAAWYNLKLASMKPIFPPVSNSVKDAKPFTSSIIIMKKLSAAQLIAFGMEVDMSIDRLGKGSRQFWPEICQQ